MIVDQHVMLCEFDDWLFVMLCFGYLKGEESHLEAMESWIHAARCHYISERHQGVVVDVGGEGG